ncbi:ATP-binding protein [Amycolatopsis sp. FBCC-B4732]|uniref:ATP-binding protein n=1 Tax=Amycolatopsis sp. FBCC-B4732 TaxID=3079339 RepID=UPI001FF69B80|nr:ATP-binding protein [Amycolatopsis sp. FBCC-B4732]UOX93003.1 ATP-binding protein [Amycolatopsis sp. FBCC-B4732]
MAERAAGPAASRPWSWNLRGTSAPVLVEVRRWASRTLVLVDDTHLGDVLLVVTELVTNAYDHGRGPLEVRMDYAPGPCRVRIEVDDNSLDHPVLRVASPHGRRGRGMVLVDKLAAGWGVSENRAAGGKTVWAEVTCDGAGAVRCAAAASRTAR